MPCRDGRLLLALVGCSSRAIGPFEMPVHHEVHAAILLLSPCAGAGIRPGSRIVTGLGGVIRLDDGRARRGQ